MLRQLAI
ncbi:hypothetical protein CGLO_14628 [Colletotrichum gloeosporioides Cg-14]|nr:hypothetical protein CGLO_14628 [Colletotrichum gloeosporioides Cg-14]